MINSQFLMFLLIGGIAAAANIGSRILLNQVMPYAAAIVVSFCIGLMTAFPLNRQFVFETSRKPLHQQAAWFIAINLFAVVQTLAISLILALWLFPKTGMIFYPETVAHAIGVIVPVFTSYIGHKLLTFR